MFVVIGLARRRRRKHLSHADTWEEFWKAHDVIGPPVLLHKVWRSHATEAEIAAGLISPLEAYGDEAADKLAAREALRNALSMEYVAATCSADVRVRLVQTRLVETNLLHVQNRTKPVHAEAKATERRAKFDPVEARKMEVHLQVSSLFPALRANVFEATSGQTLFCHLAQRCSSACSRLHSHALMSLNPSLLMSTPSSEDDPLAMSDQELPFSLDRRMESAGNGFSCVGRPYMWPRDG